MGREPVQMTHLVAAARKEYAKMERPLTAPRPVNGAIMVSRRLAARARPRIAGCIVENRS
jgi:hypothetical protein